MIILSLLISIVISWVTFFLIKIPKVTPTRASSGVSLIGFGVLFVVQKYYIFDLNYFSLLIFGASFVGMCSHKIFKDSEVIMASVLYTLLFVYIKPHKYGLGGALGFSAFVSILTIYTSQKLKSLLFSKL